MRSLGAIALIALASMAIMSHRGVPVPSAENPMEISWANGKGGSSVKLYFSSRDGIAIHILGAIGIGSLLWGLYCKAMDGILDPR
jgi:hypothetical protein